MFYQLMITTKTRTKKMTSTSASARPLCCSERTLGRSSRASPRLALDSSPTQASLTLRACHSTSVLASRELSSLGCFGALTLTTGRAAGGALLVVAGLDSGSGRAQWAISYSSGRDSFDLTQLEHWSLICIFLFIVSY